MKKTSHEPRVLGWQGSTLLLAKLVGLHLIPSNSGCSMSELEHKSPTLKYLNYCFKEIPP